MMIDGMTSRLFMANHITEFRERGMSELKATEVDHKAAEQWFIDADGEHDGPVNGYLAGVLAERAARTWQPIATPPTVGQFVLLAGLRSDGGWWRDVGIYRGKDDAGQDYRDKYGADSHPTHWMALPEAPQS